MDLNERRHLRFADGPTDPGGNGADLGPARDDGRRFLAAGRDAIERALSGDSAAFLEASVQSGGQ